ncbi:MAG: viperin family antiviral radical SAM protein [Candidatus Odinarchaeota archaeon]
MVNREHFKPNSDCTAANSSDHTPKRLSMYISANYHVTSACNYECRFCFAKFQGFEQRLPLREAKRIISQLQAAGMKKITLAGGEPFLFPRLGELVEHAKQLGVTTMIVTNGSLFSQEFLTNYSSSIDWLGFSIDSKYEITEKKLGRCFRTTRTGKDGHVDRIRNAVSLARDHDIKVKINTVVTSLNWYEDMEDLIVELEPDRWKVFQVLKIEGENDRYINSLLISTKQFKSFIAQHGHLNPVTESGERMTGSYLMISPDGRFFDNTTGKIQYSKPILSVGVKKALSQVSFSLDKLLERKGLYEW